MFKTLLVISILSIPALMEVPPPPEEKVQILEIQIPEEEIRKLIRDEISRIEQEKVKQSQEQEKLNKEKLKYFRT